MNLKGIEKAANLTAEQSALVTRLVDVLKKHLGANQTRLDYYNDRNRLKNLGMAVPPKFERRVDTSIGWAAKAVDYLASRSIFDGFTAANAEVADSLARIAADNDLACEYSMGVPDELKHGCGSWTVTKGEEGEQDVVINFHDAMTSAMLWDYRHKTILAGIVIEDFAPVSDKSNRMEPCMVVLHTKDAAVEITREPSTGMMSDKWTAVQKPHAMGRPLMEPMCYRPSNCKPFGKSRITHTVMAITDEMQREVIRTAIHSECFSAPQKWMLGATDEAFDMDKFTLAYNSFMLVGKDVDGDLPQLGQFAQASMEPHIKAMESLMSRMAAETAVPVAAFGLSSNGYTSSDALRASTDDLILEAESLNSTNGKALANVARMALAIMENKSFAELTPEERDIAVHWVEPSMPSASQVADATVKLANAVPEFGGTELFWELNGLNEEQRRRVRAEMRQNANVVALNKMFGGE